MPVPIPKPNQTLSEYMSVCMTFLDKENSEMPMQQRKAVCINTYHRAKKELQRKVYLHAPLAKRALGNALLIQGPLLEPGVYTGLDGVPTKYTREFIKKIEPAIVGQPIKFAHAISPESMVEEIPKGSTVGYWTQLQKNGILRARGYIFDPKAMKYVLSHNVGLSMEADISTEYNPVDHVEEATGGMLTGGVLIDDPACPACRIEFAREVNLQRGGKQERVENTVSENNAAEEFIKFEKDENLAKPTREAFFSWLEKTMKDAGIPENIIPKAMNVLKRAIKVPYPYPYPKAQETLEALFGSEMAKELSAYTDFVGKCMKEGKSMQECAVLYKKEHPEEKTEQSELEKQLADATAKLQALEKTQDITLQEEINKLTGEIKNYDKEFEPVKFLEAQPDKVLQRRMLQTYLAVLKKNVKPISLQLGDAAAKQVVETAVKEMFGEGTTFESLFELPVKKEGGNNG